MVTAVIEICLEEKSVERLCVRKNTSANVTKVIVPIWCFVFSMTFLQLGVGTG